MDYTIREVMVGQIVVKFDDGTVAVVAVTPENTAEEIDELVSYYDPEFLPKPDMRINECVSVGEKRCSCRMEEEEEEQLDVEGPSQDLLDAISPDVGTSEVAPLDIPIDALSVPSIIFQALYYSSKGDNSVMEALHRYYDTVYSQADAPSVVASVDEIIALHVAYNEQQAGTDDVFNQALEELS